MYYHYHSYQIQHFGKANMSINREEINVSKSAVTTESKKLFYYVLLEFVGVWDLWCGALPGCGVSFEVCSLLDLLLANVHNWTCPKLGLYRFPSGISADASLSLTWHLVVRPTLTSSFVGVTSLMRSMERHWGIPRVDRYPSVCGLLNLLHLHEHLWFYIRPPSRQVSFCRGWRAARCPWLLCDGGLRMGRFSGLSSNFCRCCGWRTPTCSWDQPHPWIWPRRDRPRPQHSVSKTGGKLGFGAF